MISYLTIHPTIRYYYKVENVTVENDGTHVGGFRGGDVLVPSNYDETGGVAKVDVSNNMINHVTFYNFAYPMLQFYLTSTMDNVLMYTGNNHRLVCSSSQGSYGYYCHSSKQGTVRRVEPVVIQKIRKKWQ